MPNSPPLGSPSHGLPTHRAVGLMDAKPSETARRSRARFIARRKTGVSRRPMRTPPQAGLAPCQRSGFGSFGLHEVDGAAGRRERPPRPESAACHRRFRPRRHQRPSRTRVRVANALTVMRGLDPRIQDGACAASHHRRRLGARINPRIKSGDGRDAGVALA